MRYLVLVLVCCGNDREEAPQAPVVDTTRVVAAVKEATRAVVTGNLHSVDGGLGTWDVALSDCQSGEYRGFYGADFFVAGTTKLRLRYVHDEATGEVVKIFYPDKENTAVVFRRTDTCAVLEGSVTKMNVRTRASGKSITHLEGHVKFDCTYDEKGHVTGEVTFKHCH